MLSNSGTTQQTASVGRMISSFCCWPCTFFSHLCLQCCYRHCSGSLKQLGLKCLTVAFINTDLAWFRGFGGGVLKSVVAGFTGMDDTLNETWVDNYSSLLTSHSLGETESLSFSDYGCSCLGCVSLEKVDTLFGFNNGYGSTGCISLEEVKCYPVPTTAAAIRTVLHQRLLLCP